MSPALTCPCGRNSRQYLDMGTGPWRKGFSQATLGPVADGSLAPPAFHLETREASAKPSRSATAL